MGAWVTDWARHDEQHDFTFRLHTSLLGMLGIGGNLLEWTEAERVEATYWIARYKELRHLIQDGDQSWLLSPTETRGVLAAVQYTSPAADEAVVFFFGRNQALLKPTPLLRLRDLDLEASYIVETLQASEIQGNAVEPGIYSGAALIGRGLQLPLPENFAWMSQYRSCAVHIKKVE
jgi:alpha-galactosidase